MSWLKRIAFAVWIASAAIGCGGGREVEVESSPEEQQQQQEYLNRLQQMEQQFVEQGGPGAAGGERAPGAEE